MDGRVGKEIAQRAGLQEASDDLQYGRGHANGEGGLVGRGIGGAPSRQPCRRRRRLSMQPMAITIRPAAGPLIVSSELLRNVVTSAPMIAVKMPAIGG